MGWPIGRLLTWLRLALWLLGEQRFALPLDAVERVLPAIQVTPLPDAPELVRGIINVQGRVIPVVDMRRRFALPAREVLLSDQLVLARSARRWLSFFVDAVQGVIRHAADARVQSEAIVPGSGGIAGVVKLADGLILVHDLDRLLSLADEDVLDAALSMHAGSSDS